MLRWLKKHNQYNRKRRGNRQITSPKGQKQIRDPRFANRERLVQVNLAYEILLLNVWTGGSAEEFTQGMLEAGGIGELMHICVLQRSWSRGSCGAPQFPRCWTFGIAGWQQQHPNTKGDLLFDWVLWDWDFFLSVLLECLGIWRGTVCENMAALAVWFSLPNRFQIDLLKQERGKVRLDKDRAQTPRLSCYACVWTDADFTTNTMVEAE